MLVQLLEELRYALRRLAAKPGFVAAAILALALGIGVNTALFSAIKAVVFEPLPYPQLHSFDKLAAFADWQASIAGAGDAQMLAGMRVSPQYFDVFGVAPSLGRTFTEAEDRSARRALRIAPTLALRSE